MQNNLIDTLRDSRKSEYVAYTQFSLAYSNQNCLYCFFEGDEDKRYYGTRIKFKTDRDFKSFTCGGKDKVKKIFELITSKSEYNDSITLYFIDKDYTQESSTSNIYVTPCYSIENFYTSKNALHEIFINEFNLQTEEEDYQLVMSLYIQLQEDFHKKLLFFNAWLACQNDLREQESVKTYLKIDNVVNNYFRGFLNDNLVEISNFNDLNDLDKLETDLFPKAQKIPMSTLEEKISLFQSEDNQCIFRGKFELLLMVTFLKKLKNEICKSNSTIFTKKHKCTLVFDTSNAISVLTQHAHTPSCLTDFLNPYREIA